MRTELRLHAPAKLNLHLRVGAVRNDGFHPLSSWMVTIGLFDTLILDDAPAACASSGTILTCDDPRLPCDATNLVVRAVEAMRQAGSIPASAGVHSMGVHLQKRIPIGGGLAGGSSDAARMLMGLNQLWGLNWKAERLAGIAQELGSDVPFFLYGPSSFCTGRGEIVKPIALPRARWALLMLPETISMPTALVYRTFDALETNALEPGKVQAPVDQSIEQEWPSLSADELLPRLVNDLELPAFQISPQLADLRSELREALGRIVRMSGSGSTLFTLFDERSDAQNAAQIVHQKPLSSTVRALVVEIGAAPDDDLP